VCEVTRTRIRLALIHSDRSMPKAQTAVQRPDAIAREKGGVGCSVGNGRRRRKRPFCLGSRKFSFFNSCSSVNEPWTWVGQAANEGFCEDLARQNTVSVPAPAAVSASSHMGFYVVAYGFQSSPWCPKGHYLGRCTVCLGTNAHRPCFDLSVCLFITCLSITFLSI
jgi:hypothetical protein